MKQIKVGCKVCGGETPRNGAMYCGRKHMYQDFDRYSGESVEDALERKRARSLKARQLKDNRVKI